MEVKLPPATSVAEGRIFSCHLIAVMAKYILERLYPEDHSNAEIRTAKAETP